MASSGGSRGNSPWRLRRLGRAQETGFGGPRRRRRHGEGEIRQGQRPGRAVAAISTRWSTGVSWQVQRRPRAVPRRAGVGRLGRRGRSRREHKRGVWWWVVWSGGQLRCGEGRHFGAQSLERCRGSEVLTLRCQSVRHDIWTQDRRHSFPSRAAATEK